VAVLDSLNVEGLALIVLDKVDRNIALASRNVPGIEVVTCHHVNAYELIRYPRIIISKAAMGPLQERLAAGQGKKAS
jgi:large subunit ribosomal protein L4